MLDVTAEIEIHAEPTDVAAVMFDPHRDPDWVGAVRAVEVLDPGIKPGARVRRTGTLAGGDTSWTTEVVSFHFPHVLELRVTDGPIRGMVICEVGRCTGGSVARIRHVGEVTSPPAEPESRVEADLRTALVADLQRLKTIVEQARTR